VVVIAAAFAIAVASVAFAVRAFRSSRELQPAASDSFAHVRGWIACGGDLLRAIDPSSTAGSVTQVRLTTDQDPESPVAWSTDGSRLLVDRASRGGHYFFALSGDGTEVRVEPVSTVTDVSSFSPGGGKVVYGSDGAVWAVDVDSHTVRVIARGGTLLPQYLQHPSLSPDGTQIAYMQIAHGGGQAELWVMNADGSGRRLISDSRKLWDFGPMAWSPDGTRLAVAFYSQQHRFLISVIHVDGSGFTRLAAGASPSWSPDGSRIAYTRPGDGQLMTVNADGSNVRDLGVSCRSAAWNPVPAGP
jgi:Tol biopolymer transport system component